MKRFSVLKISRKDLIADARRFVEGTQLTPEQVAQVQRWEELGRYFGWSPEQMRTVTAVAHPGYIEASPEPWQVALERIMREPPPPSDPEQPWLYTR